VPSDGEMCTALDGQDLTCHQLRAGDQRHDGQGDVVDLVDLGQHRAPSIHETPL